MKTVIKLTESDLHKMVMEAVGNILGDGKKDDKKDEKNDSNSNKQWNLVYNNDERGDNKNGAEVEMRTNPDTNQPEYRIASNPDKKYKTQDAAMNALYKGEKRVSNLDEGFGDMENDGKLPMDFVMVSLRRTKLAMDELNKCMGADGGDGQQLKGVMTQLQAIEKNLKIVLQAAGRDLRDIY